MEIGLKRDRKLGFICPLFIKNLQVSPYASHKNIPGFVVFVRELPCILLLARACQSQALFISINCMQDAKVTEHRVYVIVFLFIDPVSDYRKILKVYM